jgi:hypothetical protein
MALPKGNYKEWPIAAFLFLFQSPFLFNCRINGERGTFAQHITVC